MHTSWTGSAITLVAAGAVVSLAVTAVVILVVVASFVRTRRPREPGRDS